MIHANFYALNSSRPYPIEDGASCRDDRGNPLPPGIIVDCSLRFFADRGSHAFISAVSAGPRLVTIAIEGCVNPARPGSIGGPASEESFRPLGTISVTPPYKIHTPIPIIASEEGVIGWIVLGRGASVPYAGTFSGPSQAGLLPRCARGVRRPPVTSLDSLAGSGMTGAISLLGGLDVQVVTADQILAGTPTRCIQFGLAAPGSRALDLLKTYAGPCGTRPESGTCDPPVVESLGGAVPDSDGNIEVVFDPEFAGLTTFPLVGATGGLVVDFPRTLDDVCPSPASTSSMAVVTQTTESSKECGGSYAFPDPDWDLTVLSGVFSQNESGCVAASGVPVAAVAASYPFNRVSASFLLPYYEDGPDSASMAGGVVFDYTPAVGATPASYRKAILDVKSLILTSAFVVVGGATTVEATIGLPPSVLPETLSFTGASVVVTIGDRKADGSRRVNVAGSYMAGAGYLNYTIPSGSGGFGIAAEGAGPTFKTLTAESL